MGAQHRFEEHVGEVQIRLEAPSRAELYAEAGRALADLQLEEPRQHLASVTEDVTVRAADREALLAEWLNELIFRSETSGRAFTAFDVTSASDRELRARIGGVPIGTPRVAVKAATLHALRIEERDGLWSATVVLDV